MSTGSPVTREYLETIYNLTLEGEPVVGARLAEKFRVSPPNVAQVLKRMEAHGLIRMPGRGRGRAGEGIELTGEGRAEAEVMLRQHRLAERFLVDIMGMDWVQAHEEAHNIERGMSPAIEQQMMRVLGNPLTCPHGNPIPTGTGNTLDYLREKQAIRLADAQPGVPMRVLLISEVVEDESALLTHLGRLHIMPGALVTLVDRHAPERTVDVRIVPREDGPNGEHEASLPVDLAAKIWVRS